MKKIYSKLINKENIFKISLRFDSIPNRYHFNLFEKFDSQKYFKKILNNKLNSIFLYCANNCFRVFKN